MLGSEKQRLLCREDRPEREEVPGRSNDRGEETIDSNSVLLQCCRVRGPPAVTAPRAAQLEVLATLESNDPDGEWCAAGICLNSAEALRRGLSSGHPMRQPSMLKNGVLCRHCVTLREWFDYRGHVCMVRHRSPASRLTCVMIRTTLVTEEQHISANWCSPRHDLVCTGQQR